MQNRVQDGNLQKAIEAFNQAHDYAVCFNMEEVIKHEDIANQYLSKVDGDTAKKIRAMHNCRVALQLQSGSGGTDADMIYSAMCWFKCASLYNAELNVETLNNEELTFLAQAQYSLGMMPIHYPDIAEALEFQPDEEYIEALELGLEFAKAIQPKSELEAQDKACYVSMFHGCIAGYCWKLNLSNEKFSEHLVAAGTILEQAFGEDINSINVISNAMQAFQDMPSFSAAKDSLAELGAVLSNTPQSPHKRASLNASAMFASRLSDAEESSPTQVRKPVFEFDFSEDAEESTQERPRSAL